MACIIIVFVNGSKWAMMAAADLANAIVYFHCLLRYVQLEMFHAK